MEHARMKAVPIKSSISETGADEEAYMIWVVGSLAYAVAVVSIVRFMQFVSDADHAIMEFSLAEDGMSRLHRRIREFVPSSTKVAKRRGTLKTKKSPKDFSRRLLHT
jgi:hypothetical protein